MTIHKILYLLNTLEMPLFVKLGFPKNQNIFVKKGHRPIGLAIKVLALELAIRVNSAGLF